MKRHFDAHAVNALYLTNPVAKTVIEALAAMPRQDETVMDDLQVEAPRRDVVEVFKTLDHFGAGEFVSGRRGHPSRFRWYVDSLHIAGRKSSVNDGIAVQPPTQPSEAIFHHRFRLRPEYEIDIALPVDFTPSEANRLARFLSSVPFKDDEEKV